MNILMLNHEFPPLIGGAGNATARLLEQFAEEGDLKFELVTSSPGTERIESLGKGVHAHFLDVGKRDNLPFLTWKNRLSYALRALPYARRLVRQNRYDLCHAFFALPAGGIARKLGLPTVVSLRGADVPCHEGPLHHLDRFLLRPMTVRTWKRATTVVANSSKLRELALRSAPQREILVIPNGVDAEMFESPASRMTKGLRVLTVSPLIARKGLRHLIKAVFEIHETHVTLTVVGAGNQEVELYDVSRELRATGRIQFRGYIPHEKLPEVYRDHDVFVLPSYHEGMSNAVLEAMASGLPILMTDTGGARELLEHGKNGYGIRQGSPEDITRRLRAYFEDGKLVVEHGKRSREIAEKFSWKAAAGAYRELYRSVGRGGG